MEKLTPYPKYKSSGIDWLQQIPANWEMKKAKYCFKYTTGFTPPTGEADFYDEDIIWITIRDMDQKVVFDSATKLSQYAIDKYQPDCTKKGALLFSFKLSVGKVAFAGVDLYTNEAIISILPNSNYEVRYFYYTLPEQLLQNANENIYGAKILNQELIRNALVCFPSLEEQTAIASFLDQKTARIDTLIAKKQKLIEALKEERTAIINHAVTKGINPKAKLKPSGIDWLGDIPEHWEIKRINSLSELLTGYAFKSDNFSFDDGIKLVRGDNITEGYLRWGDKTRCWQGSISGLSDFLLNAGDIVIGMDGSKVGKNFSMVTDEHLPLLLVQRVARIRTLTPPLRNWIYNWIGTELFRFYVNTIKTDPAIPHITLKNIKDFKVTLPKDEEIIDILEFINTSTIKINSTITKIQSEIELMQEYRTALISEVVTGKVKVN